MQKFSMKSYKHIIIDFDGTIVDTEKLKFAAFFDAFSDISDVGRDSIGFFLKEEFGKDRIALLKKFNIVFSQNLEIASFLTAFESMFISRLDQSPQIKIEGVLEFLSRYSDDKEIYIVSKNQFFYLVDFIHKYCPEIYPFLSGVYACTEKTTIFEMLVKNSSILESCLSIGDRMSDYQIAGEYGVDFIFMNAWNPPENPSAPSYRTFLELSDV